jgi:hypothetical protein
MGHDERWALAYEYGPEGTSGPVGIQLPVGRSIVVGREGDLPLGVAIIDPGISRRAVEVSATPDGWDIDVLNTNRAVLYSWGQSPVLVSGRHRLSWPRIALHVLNGDRTGTPDTKVHWLLLEADSISVTPAGPEIGPGSQTFRPDPPPPLTAFQEAAIRAVFGELWAWPPKLDVQPVMLATVGRALGISESAVQERLKSAREKALQLGLRRACGLTDPEYVYVLVRAGLLAPPQDRIPRSVQAWQG